MTPYNPWLGCHYDVPHTPSATHFEVTMYGALMRTVTPSPHAPMP